MHNIDGTILRPSDSLHQLFSEHSSRFLLMSFSFISKQKWIIHMNLTNLFLKIKVLCLAHIGCNGSVSCVISKRLPSHDSIQSLLQSWLPKPRWIHILVPLRSILRLNLAIASFNIRHKCSHESSVSTRRIKMAGRQIWRCPLREYWVLHEWIIDTYLGSVQIDIFIILSDGIVDFGRHNTRVIKVLPERHLFEKGGRFRRNMRKLAQFGEHNVLGVLWVLNGRLLVCYKLVNLDSKCWRFGGSISKEVFA